MFSVKSCQDLSYWVELALSSIYVLSVMSVSGSLVVTCLERADTLAPLYVMFPCILSHSHTVSWVRCGT